MRRRKQTVAIALGAAVLLAVGAWVAGGQVRSPAQIAAQTAAPDPSAITVPVEKRVLSSEVIVRGTVRYGSPQPVVLSTSEAKQQAVGGTGADIVTTRPRRGARFGEGTDVMSVSGRPVFVLRGAQPSHRDLGPGTKGPDVRQLEAALARMGFAPGPVDGRYDGETAAAVADWYQKSGWDPFGSTNAQLDQLRAARASAAAARDAYIQAKLAIQTAAHGATPGDIAQARIDLETARAAVNTAESDLTAARIKARQAKDLARQNTGTLLATLNERRDNALADADVALKRAALNKAFTALAEARRNLSDLPDGTPPAEQAALQSKLRDATDDIAVAQADLNAANASANATRAAGRDTVAKARVEARQADRDASAAQSDLERAQRTLPSARRQVTLSARRLQVLTTPGDTTLQRALAQSAGQEARGTARAASRLAGRLGIQVPADEVLFFSTLPLRVDSVRAKRGDSVTGRVMTVSNSRLAVDSSLSVTDAKLVRRGAPVTIEEPDLGVKTTGVVSQVADRPGTHKVDPGRIYLEVAPSSAPAQLVGASVKLTIAVKSTEQAVLVVPVTALSVGADGTARLQVRRAGGASEYVTVAPGLAAKGLVEVRPVRGRLEAGDLVVVGARGTSSTLDSTSATNGGSPPSSGTLKEPPKKEPPNATPPAASADHGGGTTTGTTTGESTTPKGTTTTPSGGEKPSTNGGQSTGPTP